MKNLENYIALTNFIQKNKCFSIVGNVVMCKLCTTSFKYIPRNGTNNLQQHLLTKIHKKNEQSSYLQKNLFTLSKEEFEIASEFDVSLLKAFCEAQIPLSKLENPAFRSFLEKYTKKTIKSESWFRKTLLSKVYTDEMEKNYLKLSDKNIYLMFDETTDANGRYILHLLAGECSKNDRKIPVLFKTIELEKTNAANINQVIINFLMKLHGGKIFFDKVKLIISDQAPYAVKVGKLLKDLIPSLKHITCLCHLIHRLCQCRATFLELRRTFLFFLLRGAPFLKFFASRRTKGKKLNFTHKKT